MNNSILHIAIAILSEEKCLTDEIKKIKLPENIKTEIIFAKDYDDAIVKAKNMGASHIACINENEIYDKNWLINQIDFYKNQDAECVCSGITYKKYAEDYPDFVINNRLFRVFLKRKLLRVKNKNKNLFLSVDNYKNINIKNIVNYNSVSYILVENISIIDLIIQYISWILKKKRNFEVKSINTIKKWYRRKTGKNLGLKNPRTYNEKVQWMKLYDSTPIKTELTDKYLVRNWVKEKIGEEYLIPLLGVWDSFDDINFDKLPEQFVLKCNHGCGYNIIVKDKNKFNKNKARKKINKWLKKDYGLKGYEQHYSDINKKIIAEKYLENSNRDLYDYKVWCFSGKAHYIQFLSERNTKGLKMAFYDRKWIKQDFVYSHPMDDKNIEKPKNLDLLLSLAEKLSQGFNHVRADFYITNEGKIYFGEMTFTSCSGICDWKPDYMDMYFGNLLELPIDKNKPKLIVSLTSFPYRIPTVHMTIESILNQTHKPNFIVLQLAEEEFPNKEKDLPENLLKLTKCGLIIRWNKINTKSYKKLIPTLKEFPNDVIITVDDDIIYDKNMIKRLWESYLQNTHYIHCHRTTKVLLNKDNSFKVKPKHFYKKPSFANKLVGCGGVLYPPNSLYKDVLNGELFLSLAPTNDDIWFWLMAVMNNTKINVVKHNIANPKVVKETKQGPCLCKINDKGEKLFFKDLDRVLNHYDGLKEKIIKDM